MAATKAIIGFPRATDSFTLSGGSWSATYPLRMLKVLPLSKIARTNDALAASSVILATTAGATAKVGMLGLAGHNLSLAATVRARLYSDAAWTTQIADTGVQNAWPNGLYSVASDIAGGNWTWICWFGQIFNAASIRIDISDTANSAGYVQAGWLEIASATIVSYNFKWGAQPGFRFRSDVTEAIGGAKYVYEKGKPRTFAGSFELPSAEALSQHFERWRQLDLSRVFLWLPKPDDPSQWPREAYLCQNVDPGKMGYAFVGNGTPFYSVPFGIEEVIG